MAVGELNHMLTFTPIGHFDKNHQKKIMLIHVYMQVRLKRAKF